MAYRRTPAVAARLDATHARIVHAARAEVARHGLAGLNVADVAAGARVSVGTVYRHFSSKQELLADVVTEICGHERDMVAKAAADLDDPVERLLAAVDCFAERAIASGRVAHAVIAESAPPEIDADRIRHRHELAAVFARFVADAVDAGRLPHQDPAITGQAIVGAVSEILVGHPDAAGALRETRALIARSVGAV